MANGIPFFIHTRRNLDYIDFHLLYCLCCIPKVCFASRIIITYETNQNATLFCLCHYYVNNIAEVQNNTIKFFVFVFYYLPGIIFLTMSFFCFSLSSHYLFSTFTLISFSFFQVKPWLKNTKKLHCAVLWIHAHITMYMAVKVRPFSVACFQVVVLYL